MCHGGRQASSGPYCAGFGSFLPGICCWPRLGQDIGWFLWSSPLSLGAVNTASLPAAAAGAKLIHSGKRPPRCSICVLRSRYPLLLLLVVCVPVPVPSQSKTGLNAHMGAKKSRVFAKPILPQSLHSGTIDECLCSQHWLFISRSCHFFIWDHLVEVFCQ